CAGDVGDKSSPDRWHRQSDRGGASSRRPPNRGSEFRWLAVRSRRQLGQKRDRSARLFTPSALRESLAAIRHLEQAVTQSATVDGAVLRYGFLYGAPERAAFPRRGAQVPAATQIPPPARRRRR